MIWRVRVRDVRRHAGGLGWTLVARTPDLESLVYADTTEHGSLFDLQSDEYVGTTGDAELDQLVAERIQQAISSRHAAQSLDAVDRSC